METRKIKFSCHAVKWFDRINGNTYHSVRITRMRDGKIIAAPFQYGYGEAYRDTALELMAKNKWLPVKYRGKNPWGGGLWHKYERENNYPILWSVEKGLKRDCVANGIV